MEREQPVPQAEIITLAWHVDYWNYLGWKDEFSSAEFSKRQESYGRKFKIDSIYTPQMVVDGQTEFVGNNSGKAVTSIMAAANLSKASIELAMNENLLKINISEISKIENATVFAAVAEDKLSTSVKRGENSGRVLEHSSVVRQLKTIGVISGASSTFSGELDLPIQPNWKKENLKIIVFVQENNTRKILGVNQIQYK